MSPGDVTAGVSLVVAGAIVVSVVKALEWCERRAERARAAADRIDPALTIVEYRTAPHDVTVTLSDGRVYRTRNGTWYSYPDAEKLEHKPLKEWLNKELLSQEWRAEAARALLTEHGQSRSPNELFDAAGTWGLPSQPGWPSSADLAMLKKLTEP